MQCGVQEENESNFRVTIKYFKNLAFLNLVAVLFKWLSQHKRPPKAMPWS